MLSGFEGDRMRTTKRDVRYEMFQLEKETGLKLYLEEYSFNRKNQFTLLQVDENGAAIKTLIEDYCTTKEMYLILRAAREIYKATMDLQSLQKVRK